MSKRVCIGSAVRTEIPVDLHLIQLVLAAFAAFVLASSMLACGGSSSSNTAPPPPPPPPSLQSISVGPGNTSILAGTTQQFSATATYSDGSTNDVTTSASWSSANQNIATVNSTGLAATLTEGTTTITATLQSIAGSAPLTATPLTVQVSVAASDPEGHPLTYQWQTTDGSIQDANAATASWTLPDGSGLHFAYVLVSNGYGGYTERRIAINTDIIGTPLQVPVPKPFSPPAPLSMTPVNNFRGFLTGGKLTEVGSFLGAGSTWSPGIPLSVPNASLTPIFLGANPATISTNLRGEFIVFNAPNTALTTPGISIFCPNGLCGSYPGTTNSNGMSISDYTGNYNFFSNIVQSTTAPDVAGEILLQDGSTCGLVDEFFGNHTAPSVTLVDSTGMLLAGPVEANQWGDFDLPYVAGGASVVVQCENNAPFYVSIPTANPSGTTQMPTTYVSASAPSVTSMTATLASGTPLPTGSATFLPPPTLVPSDVVPLGDAFLAEKGLDTRTGACQYYKAVGAVQGCDASGNFSGAITFEDWKSQVQIDQYAVPPNPQIGGSPVYSATYINKVDLNLARSHHAVIPPYPTGSSVALQQPVTWAANYVCNHSGPSVLDPMQPEIDSVIQNTVNGKNLVACVAMDYSTFPVNDSQVFGPYIRFLIFGPNGQLLPSVNLDGRREKFVPGTCVVCHGGDHYAGKYPEDGSGSPDVGGHFLPYDTGNFEFSSQPGLAETDQEQNIYNLNQIISTFAGTAGSPPITSAESQLIQGWYQNGQVLNKLYVDRTWTEQGSLAISVYQNVYARSCRTCHVALPKPYNFEQYGPFLQSGVAVDPANCGGGADRNRMYKMPNSLVTFNRFWGTQGSTSEPDQVSLFHQFLHCPGTQAGPSFKKKANAPIPSYPVPEELLRSTGVRH
jgi:hypothetical protein